MYSLLIVFFAIIIVSGLRSQFEVDCPHSCICNKSVVQCISSRYRGLSFLSTIRPEAFPELDTLVISGNSLGDIRTGIFGADVVHKFVTLFNFTNNDITAFDHSTFEGLPALEYFYFTDNQIEIVGSDPFRNNTRLHILDLSYMFSAQVSSKERSILIKRIFANSVNKFVDLQELILRGNKLKDLEPDTFCSISGLIRLHLSHNHLKTFNYKEGCLLTLDLLDLSGNDIAGLPMQMWESLPSLHSVDLSSNPLNCDCKLGKFLQEIVSASPSPLNKGKTVCAEPPSRKGQNAFDVDQSECSNRHPIFMFLVIIILIIIIVILIRIYRRRLKLNLPFVAGYSQLRATDNPNPQFV